MIQFGLLYIFGASFDGYGKKLSKKEGNVADFFEFVTLFLWQIQINSMTPTGTRLKTLQSNMPGKAMLEF